MSNPGVVWVFQDLFQIEICRSSSIIVIIPQTFPGLRNPPNPPIFVDLEDRGGSEITGGSLFIVQLTSERPSPFSRPQIRYTPLYQIRSDQIRSDKIQIRSDQRHQIGLLGKAEAQSCWCHWHWQGLRWEPPEKFSLKESPNKDQRIEKQEA